MAALSAPDGATASNSAPPVSNPVAIFTTRLSDLTLDEIVGAIGGDRSSASRVRSGERAATITELTKLIPLCGLKLVDANKVCVDRRAYESMTYIASKAMANQATAKSLIWDEGQG